jgi:PhoPQ-activated pathogenicity-related protein
MHRFAYSLFIAALFSPSAFADGPPPDLVDYVKKDDRAFAWKVAQKAETDSGTVYELDLTSQKWQDITWTHKVQIFVPKGVKPQKTMVLWNQGGRPNATSGVLGLQLATKIGAPVAFLYGIPNQPLFGGKTEDALIAETFVRYLETKDSSWPLLFPMVKSLIKAMDALQAFAKEEWKSDVTHFVVTGASKRGWTSWLTAATGDPRVKAIAPLVIDTLNFPVQMKNQIGAFGKPSEMVHDYVDRKLIPIPDTPEAKKLWQMVDPWVYRDKLTLPKMIVNGANDPYWPLDALNSYWDDLKGEKYVLYVPNAGHDLRETDPRGMKQLIPERAVNTLSAFCKAQVFDKKMPTLTWTCDVSGATCKLGVKSDPAPKSVKLWVADSPTRDFRRSRWVEQDGDTVMRPPLGFRACFGEVQFQDGDLTYPLSSRVEILEAMK